MTNGSPSIVQLLDFRVENSTRCSIIWVRFENKSTVKLWREKYAHLFIECIPSDWTPILGTTRSFTLLCYSTPNSTSSCCREDNSQITRLNFKGSCDKL